MECAMVRGLRTALLLTILIAAGSTPALAATVPGCINPADSALNQYCEVIPAATGGQTPHIGTPSVATTLPARIVRQLASGTGPQAKARRALLTLPAGLHSGKLSPAVSVAKTGGSTLPAWLFAVLAVAAAALAGAALSGKRRRRAGPGEEPLG
jgi:hypothetical protein